MSKVMAYVGSYCYDGKNKGITVFDVDSENGKFTLKIKGFQCKIFTLEKKSV